MMKEESHARTKGQAQPPTKSSSFSSNWEAIKSKIGANGEGATKKRKRVADLQPSAQPTGTDKLESKGKSNEVTPVLAVDCEMVGVGPDGKRSSLARVCIINNEGNVLLDAYVKQKERVTDYRTWVSGIKPEHLLRGEDGGKPILLLTLEEVQEKVAAMFKGRILVGHSVQNDLKALLLDHPRKDTRDTARYPLLMRSPAPGRKPKPRSLRKLASEELGVAIQEGEHSPVIDARAALYVYHKHRREWEKGIASGSLRRSQMEARAFRKTLRDSLESRALSGGAHGSGGGGGMGRLGGGAHDEDEDEGDEGGGYDANGKGKGKGKERSLKALARKARLGIGKGQVAIARDLSEGGKGKADVFKRDARLDPCADL